MSLLVKVGGPGKCAVCHWNQGFLYDGKCAPCAISGSLYGHLARCPYCGTYEGGPHVGRMHPSDLPDPQGGDTTPPDPTRPT